MPAVLARAGGALLSLLSVGPLGSSRLAACEAVTASDEAALLQSGVSLHGHAGAQHDWLSAAPLFAPSAAGFDSVAVKDPSVVFHAGSWHLFYTARGPEEYSLGYASAPRLEELASARRVRLSRLRGRISSYACAPEVFFFEPQKKWYLLYQLRDAPQGKSPDPYYPVFSTNLDVANASGWSDPRPLLSKDSRKPWIDFWIICDDARAYLFYTESQDQVMVRSTDLARFPVGWSKPTIALDHIHEAAHVYKVKDRREYHMIFEIRKKGMRSFGLARAEKLAGPWRRVTDQYAGAPQLRFAGGRAAWTDVVSHGEAIRTGFDQRLEYEASGARWLIQGMRGQDDGRRQYDDLPWSLGLINSTDTA